MGGLFVKPKPMQWAVWSSNLLCIHHSYNIKYHLMFCSCPDASFPCPAVNTYTKGRKNASVPFPSGVHSWQACSDLCRMDPGCTAWTFGAEHSPSRCYTMSGYESRFRSSDTYMGYTAVSGDRDCGKGRGVSAVTPHLKTAKILGDGSVQVVRC